MEKLIWRRLGGCSIAGHYECFASANRIQLADKLRRCRRQSIDCSRKSASCDVRTCELRRENAELRQQVSELRCEVGYWKSLHARAVERNTQLQAELDAGQGGDSTTQSRTLRQAIRKAIGRRSL